MWRRVSSARSPHQVGCGPPERILEQRPPGGELTKRGAGAGAAGGALHRLPPLAMDLDP